MVPLKVLTLVVAGQNQPVRAGAATRRGDTSGEGAHCAHLDWPHRGGTNRDGTGACEVRCGP